MMVLGARCGLVLISLSFLLGVHALKKIVWDQTALDAEESFAGYDGSDFGASVDVDSSSTNAFVLVGAPSEGKAYVYKRGDDGAWDASSPAATFSPAGSDSFGSAVAISGDYAIVGDSGNSKAFIFQLSAGEWGTNATTVIDGYTDQSNFGCSVDITDSFAIVGASGANKAFLFELGSTQTSVIFENADDSDGGSASEFGYSVSMTDTYALVGAPGVEKSYLFTKPIFYGAAWGTTASFVLKDYAGFGYTKGRFGESVAITNEHAIVGASLAQKAFFFSKVHPENIGAPGTWPESPTATIDVYAEEGGFGGAVALADSLAVVGAHGAGKAYVFAYDGTSQDGAWDTTAVATFYVTWLHGGSGDGTIPNFGASVAIDGSYTVVGANDPTAYTYVYKNEYQEVDAPSSTPSAVPTAFPTLPVSSGTLLEWEGGATLDQAALDEGLGIHFANSKTFTGLGTAGQQAWYLTLSVYGTGFGPSTSGQYLHFLVNDAVLDEFAGVPLQCAPIAPTEPVVYGTAAGSSSSSSAPTAAATPAPPEGCTAAFVQCSANIDVTDRILSEQGGSIKLGTRSYGVLSSPCPYGGLSGNVVYVKYELSASPQPTTAPSATPTQKSTSQQGTLTAGKQNKLGLKGWEQLQVVLAMGVVLAGLGVAVAKSSEADKTGHHHSLLYSAVCWGALGTELASLWTVVVIFFSHGFSDLGSSLTVFLLIRMAVGGYVAWEASSGSFYNHLRLGPYLSAGNGSGNGAVYPLVTALTVLDPAFAAFYPWKDSQLIRWTRGYPNNVVYSLVQTTTVVLACIFLAIQISYLGSGGGAFSAERDLVVVLCTVLLGVRVLVILTGCFYKRDVSALPSAATRGNNAGLAEDSVAGTASGDVEMADRGSPDRIPKKVGAVGGAGNPLHAPPAEEDDTLLTRKMRLIEDENKLLSARLRDLESFIKMPAHAHSALPSDETDRQPAEQTERAL